MRRLIINADDFGLTTGVNRAVVEANHDGVVTSATLMANSRAFADAIGLAKDLASGGAKFSVGCHVVLVDGEPLSPVTSVRTLLKSGNGTSRFRQNLNDFAAAALRGKLNPREIELEAGAQMERIQGAGVGLSHFDAHKHAHMFPAVLRPMLRAARARGVSAVRNPFGRIFPLPFGRILGDTKLWKRFAEVSMLRTLARKFRREVAAQGFRTPDGSFGVLGTGILNLELFSQIASSIPEGTWEFVCHPGYYDADLDLVRTRLRQSREQELHVLTSGEAKRALQRRGIELISYHEL